MTKGKLLLMDHCPFFGLLEEEIVLEVINDEVKIISENEKF